jgi:hypothetical protein
MGEVSKNWEKLNDRLSLESRILDEQVVEVKASDFHDIGVQPRLNAKFDKSQDLPDLFKRNNWGILPNSRNSYLVGGFNIFCEVSRPSDEELKAAKPFSPRTELQSLDPSAVYSEAAALNLLFSTGLLEEVLGEEAFPTVSGRMGSGEFKFHINSTIKGASQLELENLRSTMEIDAGYESKSGLHLFEAKNTFNDNFNIRQLYFPFRNWNKRISKPVRPFLLYKQGDVYNIGEYRFGLEENFSSIELVSHHLFTIGSFTFTPKTVKETLDKGPIALTAEDAPFPQADDVAKYEQILDLLLQGPVTKKTLAEYFEFDERQSDYYSNALRFLGLAVKTGPGEINISDLGATYAQATGIGRRQILIRQMSQLESFRFLLADREFDSRTGDRSELYKVMERDFEHIFETDASESVIKRRASTIIGWVSWIRSIGG